MEMIYSTSASSTGDSKNDSAFLGPHERQMLEQGKKEHRDTTATANRALQVRFGVGDGVRELGGAGASRRARNRLPPSCRHIFCRQQRMVGAPPPPPIPAVSGGGANEGGGRWHSGRDAPTDAAVGAVGAGDAAGGWGWVGAGGARACCSCRVWRLCSDAPSTLLAFIGLLYGIGMACLKG